MTFSPAWQRCQHCFPIFHTLHEPGGRRYGTLMVCIRCRARRYADDDTGDVLIYPPVPRAWGARAQAPTPRGYGGACARSAGLTSGCPRGDSTHGPQTVATH